MIINMADFFYLPITVVRINFLQLFSHSSFDRNRFAFPRHPPYWNSSHWLLSELKNHW